MSRVIHLLSRWPRLIDATPSVFEWVLERVRQQSFGTPKKDGMFDLRTFNKLVSRWMDPTGEAASTEGRAERYGLVSQGARLKSGIDRPPAIRAGKLDSSAPAERRIRSEATTWKHPHEVGCQHTPVEEGWASRIGLHNMRNTCGLDAEHCTVLDSRTDQGGRRQMLWSPDAVRFESG